MKKIKRAICKWLWKDNPWTKAVDEIEKACIDVNEGKCNISIMEWHLKYLNPPNEFRIEVALSNKKSNA